MPSTNPDGLPHPRHAGQSLVEAALVLPVLVFLLVSLVEIGVLTYTKVVLIGAARDGARTAAVYGDLSMTRQVVRQDLADGQLPVAGWDPATGVTVLDRGAYVEVAVQYTHRTLVPGLPALVGRSPMQPYIPLQAGALFRRRG